MVCHGAGQWDRRGTRRTTVEDWLAHGRRTGFVSISIS
jgi:hypothetical protein